MVKSPTLSLTVTEAPVPPVPPVITELESGRYKYTYHGSKSEFKDVETLKAQIKKAWEQQEGIKVESIDIIQVKPVEVLPKEPVWYDGKYADITIEHTDLTIAFTVSSPVPWAVIILLVIFIAGVIVGFLLAGAFTKLVEVVEKYPWMIPLGIIVVVGIAVAVAVAEKRRD